jgi:hypothetical protein
MVFLQAIQESMTDTWPFAYFRYYALVAACVIARKADWLRNACLAGALLFPAVAALHGVVLAAMHVNGKLPALMHVLSARLIFIYF